MAYKYFRKTRNFTRAAGGTGLLKLIRVKNAEPVRSANKERDRICPESWPAHIILKYNRQTAGKSLPLSF